MILELPIAMLACAWIGAPHTVVFAGFSSESLAERMLQAETKFIITADAFGRGGAKVVPLKKMADLAINLCQKRGLHIQCQIVVEHVHRVNTTHLPPQAEWKKVNLKTKYQN